MLCRFKAPRCVDEPIYTVIIKVSDDAWHCILVQQTCAVTTLRAINKKKQISTNQVMHSSFYCLHLAVYLDTSLEETGDALVDHPVSCTSLLTAAEMLSCNTIAGFGDGAFEDMHHS